MFIHVMSGSQPFDVVRLVRHPVLGVFLNRTCTVHIQLLFILIRYKGVDQTSSGSGLGICFFFIGSLDHSCNGTIEYIADACKYEADENINLYTAAFYLYDFLICNRNNIMITFFTSFIAYNKDSLSRFLNLDDYRKGKDSASAYGKRIYSDQKYGIISANMNKVLNHIATLDISLLNILQSVYTSPEVIAFFDNAVADKGNFFKDFYCSALEQPEALPIIITNIRLSLQKIVGDISPSNIQEIMSYGGELPNE